MKMSEHSDGIVDGLPSNYDAQENMYKEIDRILSLGKIELKLPTFSYGSVTKLDLFQCDLSALPSSLPSVLPNLSILFCMKNKFTEVPEVIGRCKQLQMVSFKSNKLSSIHPSALRPQMRWLILTDNSLESLPPSIGQCTSLQKFMLSGNKLKVLPDEIGMCTNLELIRLASNCLEDPPINLLKLPKLAWVALSDNPFLQQKGENNSDVSTIGLKVYKDKSLDDPSHGEVLGSGASGITRKFTVNGLEVAVKEYANCITSDGNPEEERRASVVASSIQCECLIKVLGKTEKGSLIMELLKNYKVFADPPSMLSCSRDVYKVDAIVSYEQAMSMVSNLLIALKKLHEHGICHGDFYGHNILYSLDDITKVRLTDFGAAFFYHKDSEYGAFIETIEIRAFGHLVEEIHDLLIKDGRSGQVCRLGSKLKDLARYCLDPTSMKTGGKNSFSNISAKWNEMV